MKAIKAIIFLFLISTSFSFAEEQNTIERIMPDQSIMSFTCADELNADNVICDDEDNVICDDGSILCDDDDYVYQNFEYRIKIKIKLSVCFFNKFESFLAPPLAVRNSFALYSKSNSNLRPFVNSDHVRRILVLRI